MVLGCKPWSSIPSFFPFWLKLLCTTSHPGWSKQHHIISHFKKSPGWIKTYYHYLFGNSCGTPGSFIDPKSYLFTILGCADFFYSPNRFCNFSNSGIRVERMATGYPHLSTKLCLCSCPT